MRKNALLALGASMLVIMSSCQKEHNTPDTPEKSKPRTEEIDKGKPEKTPDDTTDDHKKDDAAPPTEKDEKKPDTPPTEKDDKKPDTPQVEKKPEANGGDKKTERPSDHDIANRLSVAWKADHDIEKTITPDVDALFDHRQKASFTTAQLSEFVVFQATSVDSSDVYTLTAEDMQDLTLSGFRYESKGLIKFVARYKGRKEIQLSLPFSREKYYTHKVEPKDASLLFMHGVHHNPDLFTSDLFGYDRTKYEVHIESSVSNRTSLDLVLRIDSKTKDSRLATLNYHVANFKPLKHLELTISPQIGVSEKIVKYYRLGQIEGLNKTIRQWIKKINFVLTRDHENIDLVWEEDTETRAAVLTPTSNAKRYADIYFVNPRFTVTEVQKLSDTQLKLKIRLDHIGETEVEDTYMNLTITIPNK